MESFMPKHQRTLIILLLTLLGTANLSFSASLSGDPGPEHIIWDRSPIKVVLPIGKERRIDFPVPIKLVAPPEVVSASKPIQIREDGSVYWTATKPFKVQRVQAITVTGYSYLLDVEAKKVSTSHPIVIIDERVPVEDDEESVTERRHSYNYDFVDLTRLAAQSVYAPGRLVKALPGVTRVSVSGLACSNHLYRFHELNIRPIASWQSPGVPTRYVTAVRVKSRSSEETVFDPRLLRGTWLAASAQHSVLGPAGSDDDNTTWYLVSAGTFEESFCE
jgi:integrating conjugative element protein (TIGR03749 family)